MTGSERGGAIHAVVRARWVVLAVFVALCAWLLPGVGKLQHDDDVLAFLPPDHPDVIAFHRVADRFGMLEVALVGIRAADHGDLLTPERSESVRVLARSLSDLPGVRLVLDYPSLPDLAVEGDTLAVDPLVPRTMTDPAQLRARVLGNRDAVGNLVSADGSAATIIIYLLPTFDELGGRTAVLADIRRIVAEKWDGEAFFGGAPFIERAAADSSREDITRLSPVVIGVLTVTSAILLRSLTAALVNLVIAGLGVGLIVGAHGVFGEPFTIVSSTTPVMIVALGGAFGMHIIAGYQRSAGTAQQRASAALRELWVAVVLSAATTAVSFFALVVMPQAPMQRFGIVAGCGVVGLMFMALSVLPCMLSLLPARLLITRPPMVLPWNLRVPAWGLAVLLAIGGFFASRLQADPDTRNVFDATSEPAQADAFFNDNFGGSQYIQIAIVADMREPVVLRAIRDLTDQLRAIEGVVDVRSLVDPTELLTEGFGGRRGIPENAKQAGRVLINLADHPAMAQLLVNDLSGAIVHVKLAPLDSDALVRATNEVRAATAALPAGPLRVGATTVAEVRAAQVEAVRVRLARLLAREVTTEELEGLVDPNASNAELLAEVRGFLDRALGTDEIIEPLAKADYAAVAPEKVLELSESALADYLRQSLPKLAEKDPEGPKFVAQQLTQWVGESRQRGRVQAMCKTLGLSSEPDKAVSKAPVEDPMGLDLGDDDTKPVLPAGPCLAFSYVISELGDTLWGVPEGVDVAIDHEVPWEVTLTGQPLIGQAFAQSVTTSLYQSSLISAIALAFVLLLGRQLAAMLPALWSVAVTMGIVSLLGHPIGIGTSMVSCIAMGAGVDFAIHLGVRARAATGPDPGVEAVAELGGVAVVTGVQLAAAFAVLLLSTMPPLRQFGVGLAVGLIAAAAGAVAFAPVLYRSRRR